jgi:hypothetical protein
MTLPDLDELIAEVDRTCVSTDWIERLKVAATIAAQLQNLGDELVADFVEHARFRSRPWSEIGDALGVTRQAAQQRFLAPHVLYTPEEFSDELRRAMAATKKVAIQHRHNYIGTEHILLGLLAEPNAATRLLDLLGVAAADLCQAVEPRLTLGASQAAERIAFTPYARKIMALAKEASVEEAAERIGCDHVLVGILRLGRGMAASALREAEVTTEAIERVRPARPSGT